MLERITQDCGRSTFNPVEVLRKHTSVIPAVHMVLVDSLRYRVCGRRVVKLLKLLSGYMRLLSSDERKI